MARALRPRATDALVVAPIAITDRTCAALCGQDPKPWRAHIVKIGCRHVIQGKRMIVLVADYVAAIERAAGAIDAPVISDAELVDDEPASVDQLLARLGRRRAA